ncbi:MULTISPECIES: cupin domain-containing protein [Klebsiella]|uniref:Protein of uncharacterized function (DUF861) n=1 Tax=Klebsiella variicola TaxID=244366 RepID=A0ABD7P9R7_KLEVA|nr:cupin domain-containing protein [Klebsiella variicola]MCD9672817.1 cupin domain-containing protein [Klebsiella variicola subsp. variicola]MCK6050119.1 DUF861 domain-containing protein [Klebsiella variicola]PXL32391.1 hypothetical protein DMS60_25110 [Klebsiella variicola]SXF96998.1 Protein of uncharacterised function (DUF861) [Klebsiella variicola]
MALTKIKSGMTFNELQHEGSLTALGGEIFEGGDVKFRVQPTYGAPTDPINAGYFGTTKGVYRLVYPFDEQATITSGEVKITDEGTGETHFYKTGDSWFITAGTSTKWEVVSANYTKHYYSVVPA